MAATTKYPNLKKAPIREAIIQVNLSPPLSEKQLDRFKQHVERHYPVAQSKSEVSLGVPALGQSQRPPVAMQREKKRFFSNDKKWVVHFEPAFLFHSRLKPYTNSEDLFGSFLKLWKSYVGETEIDKVSVILRYINEFPMSSKEAEELLNIDLTVNYGDLTDKVTTRSVEGCVDADVADIPGYGNIAAFTRFRMVEIPHEKLSVLLDNEVRLEQPVKYRDIETIRGALKVLSNIKNEIFFNSIGDAQGYFG